MTSLILGNFSSFPHDISWNTHSTPLMTTPTHRLPGFLSLPSTSYHNSPLPFDSAYLTFLYSPPNPTIIPHSPLRLNLNKSTINYLCRSVAFGWMYCPFSVLALCSNLATRSSTFHFGTPVSIAFTFIYACRPLICSEFSAVPSCWKHSVASFVTSFWDRLDWQVGEMNTFPRFIQREWNWLVFQDWTLSLHLWSRVWQIGTF